MVQKNTPEHCLQRAGKQLSEQNGNSLISRSELVRLAMPFGGYQESSLIPSDYCYNRINRAAVCFQTFLFIQEGHGSYRYVGENYSYSGPVYWKPKGEPQQEVGEWINGKYTLNYDPRHK